MSRGRGALLSTRSTGLSLALQLAPMAGAGAKKFCPIFHALLLILALLTRQGKRNGVTQG
jgi:hypothetical protein